MAYGERRRPENAELRRQIDVVVGRVTRRVMRALAWFSFGIMILFTSFVALAVNEAKDSRDRDETTCAMNKAVRRDTLSRDHDIRSFMLQAAAARRADGQELVAQGYERLARNAARRMSNTRARLAVDLRYCPDKLGEAA